MQNITTPTRGEDGIERLKRSLSLKWGIALAPRDSTWSPSKQDPQSLDDKIHACIRFLFWKKGMDAGALDYALSQFERHAPAIVSHWVFKPKGEGDVVPTRPARDSSLTSAFLKKRSDLANSQEKELKQCLFAKLNDVAERLKRQESYIPDVPLLQSIEPGGLKEAGKKGVDEAKLRDEQQNVQMPSAKSSSSGLRQAPINQWFRSKSAPSQASSSIDEFPDDSTESLLNTIAFPKATLSSGPLPPLAKSSSEENSSNVESYETPPSTPPSMDKKATANANSTYAMLPPDGKKRRFSDRHPAPELEGPSHETYKRRAPSTSYRSLSSHSNRSPMTSFNSETSAASSQMTTTTLASAITSPNTSFSDNRSIHSEKLSVDESSAGDSDITVHALMQLEKQANSSSVALQMETDLETKGIESEGETLRQRINMRLYERSPFGGLLPEYCGTLPFCQVYEMLRVAQYSQIDLASFGPELRKARSDYKTLWALLSKEVKSRGAKMPEPSNPSAWDDAGTHPNRVALSGRLRFAKGSKDPLLSFNLRPLRLEPSYRLSREFGSGRFFTLGFPGFTRSHLPQEYSKDPLSAGQAIIDWMVDTQHSFLRQKWRAFFVKEDTASGKTKGNKASADDRFKMYMFAEDGFHFRSGQLNGELDPLLLNYEVVSAQEMLNWFMHADMNSNQPALKLFSRLQLAVSKTKPTIEFLPSQIYQEFDTRADAPGPRKMTNMRWKQGSFKRSSVQNEAPSMNDGCARLSKAAGRDIRDHLGLDYIPSALQGRFNSAKGMWMIDPDSNQQLHKQEKWIEVTESQSKFETHPADNWNQPRAKFTFEVNDFVKSLRPSSLTIPLMLILHNRGVSNVVFEAMLRKDLSEKVCKLEASMGSPLDVLWWNQQNRPNEGDISTSDASALLGGLPASPHQEINFLIESGFRPTECRYLKDLLYDAIKTQCLRLEQNIRIEIPQSTYAFMVADHLGVLEENEVHLGFSSPFRDSESGTCEHELHSCDVLVARSPAYLPSDIQKVHAVFKPELRSFRDVIIFPSRGSVSLASKLSGGDYDGDKAWVCWDNRLVRPFQNADVPAPTPMETFGIEKDDTKVAELLDNKKQFSTEFIRHGFRFNLQPSILGICSSYHQSLCYKDRSIASPTAIEIANLLGLLVDSAKGGFIFDEAKWLDYLESKNLLPRLPKPAYKTLNRAESNGHFIDRLMFKTAKEARESALRNFEQRFQATRTMDEELVATNREEVENAKTEPGLSEAMNYFDREFNAIADSYKRGVSLRDPARRNHGEPPEQHGENFRATVIACRQSFCDIAPIPPQSTAKFSDRIQRWQIEHEKGRTKGPSSEWELLKASMAFKKYHYTGMIWHIAGVELCEIKATAGGPGTYRIVKNEFYTAFKVNRKVVESRKGRDDFDAFVDALEEGDDVNMLGVEEDDEYGDWPSDDDF